MARSDTLQGSLDLLVLKALSRRPCLHGYAIMAAIGERSNDLLRNHQGSHYPALHRMEEGGWTRAEWVTKEAAAERAPTSLRKPVRSNSRTSRSARMQSHPRRIDF